MSFSIRRGLKCIPALSDMGGLPRLFTFCPFGTQCSSASLSSRPELSASYELSLLEPLSNCKMTTILDKMPLNSLRVTVSTSDRSLGKKKLGPFSGGSRISQTGDANPQGGGANLLFGQMLNCMKKKEIGRVPGTPNAVRISYQFLLVVFKVVYLYQFSNIDV